MEGGAPKSNVCSALLSTWDKGSWCKNKSCVGLSGKSQPTIDHRSNLVCQMKFNCRADCYMLSTAVFVLHWQLSIGGPWTMWAWVVPTHHIVTNPCITSDSPKG